MPSSMARPGCQRRRSRPMFARWHRCGFGQTPTDWSAQPRLATHTQRHHHPLETRHRRSAPVRVPQRHQGYECSHPNPEWPENPKKLEPDPRVPRRWDEGSRSNTPARILRKPGWTGGEVRPVGGRSLSSKQSSLHSTEPPHESPRLRPRFVDTGRRMQSLMM